MKYKIKDGHYIVLLLILIGLIFLGADLVNSTIWDGTNIAGLMNWYTFNNTLTDNSGSNHTYEIHAGTTGNVYFMNSGAHSSAIYFNNSDETSPSYLFNLTDVNSVPPTTTGTIEAWVNGTFKADSGSSLQNLMNIYSQATSSAHNGNRLYINASGDRIWCQVPRADNSQVNVEINVSLNKGVWNHVACTWNLSEIDIYLNKVNVRTLYDSSRTTHPGTVTGYCTGCSCTLFSSACVTYPFVGAIDELMVWNVYRNVTQIGEDAGNYTPTVNEAPTFYNYLDNSGLLTGSGIGLFNVSMSDFNGSVYLHINNSNYTATNLYSNVFNASVFLVNGTYSYYWGSWGNTTNNTYGQSDLRTFTINNVVSLTNWTKEVAISINFTNLNITTNKSVLINISYDAFMLSNFSDLRFWNTEKTAELGYWFYNNSFVPSNSVRVWVRMDRNVSSSANATIFMRYGNSQVTTTSDVGKAGLLGDDFSFTDSSKWASGNMGIHVVANIAGGHNGSMSLPFATSANSLSTILNYSNFITETRCIFADDNEAAGPSFALYSTNSQFSAFGANTYAGAGSAGATFARMNGDNAGNKINGTQFFIETIAYKNSTYGYVNLTNETSPNIVQKTDIPPATQAWFEYYQGNAQTSYCDWIFVRRYSEDTPTITFSTATDLGSGSTDNDYPSFTNYWDNNASLVGSGIGLFNVTVLSTNNTVIFHLANYTILASKTGNVYNASLSLTNGTYIYNWTAYGNGSSTNLNTSAIRDYTLNSSSGADTTAPYFTTIPANASIIFGQSLGVDFDATDETAFDSFFINQTNWFNINQSGWLKNITALSAGTYYINVSINDTSNNINSTIFKLTLNMPSCNYNNISVMAPTIDNSMVLYYHFNNDCYTNEDYDNSNFISDYSLASNNGTYFNTIYNSTGSYLSDGSLAFNALNSIVNVTFSQSLNLTMGTINVWVKQTGYGGDKAIISNYNGANRGYDIYLQDNGNVIGRIGNGTALTAISSGAGYASANTWTMISYVWNQSMQSLYINGLLISNGSVKGAIISSNALYIGRVAFTPATYFNGSIDDPIIYNVSLSSSDLATIYKSYVPCFTPTGSNSLGLDNLVCQGNYYLNSSGTGLFTFASNSVLNCNNSNFIGNRTSGLRGIYLNSKTNVTILNCNFTNYDEGIRLYQSNNINLTSNYFNNSLTKGLYLINSNYSNFVDNYFDNQVYSIYLESSNNINLSYNYFKNSTDYSVNIVNYGLMHYFFNNTFKTNGIFFSKTNSSIIYSNQFLFRTDNQRFSIYIQDGNYNNISGNLLRDGFGLNHNFQLSHEQGDNIFNNYFLNTSSSETVGTSFSLQVSGVSSNIAIFGNNFTQQDIAIRILNTTNLDVFNNIIDGSYTGRDGYGNGVLIDGNSYQTRNVRVYNNNFTRIGSNAVIFHGTNNISIYGNYIGMLSDLESILYPLRLGNEPKCAIFATEIYKTWTGDNMELPADNLTNKIGGYKSSNVSIYNNVFNSDTQCFGRFQGTVNYTMDFVNYWYRTFQAPIYLVDRDEFYLSNSFNFITTKNGSYSITDVLGQGWMGSSGSTIDIEYKLYKDYLYFKNVNTTNQGIIVFNFTSFLAFNTNGTIYGSLNIASNNGQINITLPSNNGTCVFDNANITEGVSRGNGVCNFPIYISSKSDTGKVLTYTIQSNLTNSISNITFYPSDVISCTSLNVSYPTPVNYSCESNYLKNITFIAGFSNLSSQLVLNYLSSSPPVTPPGGGGGSNTDNSVNKTIDEINKLYNRTIICDKIKSFIKLYGINYTNEEYSSFKNNLNLLLGLPITDSILKPYISNFNTLCSDFMDKETTAIFGEDKSTNYIPLIVFLGVIVFVIVVILIFQLRNVQEVTLNKIERM